MHFFVKVYTFPVVVCTMCAYSIVNSLKETLSQNQAPPTLQYVTHQLKCLLVHCNPVHSGCCRFSYTIGFISQFSLLT